MAQNKTDKTPASNCATTATRGAGMKRPANEEYRRAVEIAKAAIEEVKNHPRIRADRLTPQATLAAIKAKAAKGEAPSAEELGALGAAMEEREAAKVKRKRGRPKGSGRATLERKAVHAALMALADSRLKLFAKGQPRCSAIAEAMQACKFRKLNTPEAVAFEARKFRSLDREVGRFMAVVNAQLAPIRAVTRHVQSTIDAATAPARRAQAQATAISRAVQEPTRRIREILKSRFLPDA